MDLARNLPANLSRDGYSLALLARSKDALDALCQEINSQGGNARIHTRTT
jgi:short-subunit dehydrogenase